MCAGQMEIFPGGRDPLPLLLLDVVHLVMFFFSETSRAAESPADVQGSSPHTYAA